MVPTEYEISGFMLVVCMHTSAPDMCVYLSIVPTAL